MGRSLPSVATHARPSLMKGVSSSAENGSSSATASIPNSRKISPADRSISARAGRSLGRARRITSGVRPHRRSSPGRDRRSTYDVEPPSVACLFFPLTAASRAQLLGWAERDDCITSGRRGAVTLATVTRAIASTPGIESWSGAPRRTVPSPQVTPWPVV